jgi:hypothetical protein
VFRFTPCVAKSEQYSFFYYTIAVINPIGKSEYLISFEKLFGLGTRKATWLGTKKIPKMYLQIANISISSKKFLIVAAKVCFKPNDGHVFTSIVSFQICV